MMTSVKIIVAAHKTYWMPVDPIYQPMQVGAVNRPSISSDWLRDDQGENISQKNETFCELTAVYWAWKHIDSEMIGFCHYRRYLGDRHFWRRKRDRLLTEKAIQRLMEDAEVILPVKRHYWIETRESQYAHAHHEKDLRCAGSVLAEKYPSFVPAWQKMLRSRSGHICNMFLMRREPFEEYCAWLFDILFEVERRTDLSGYSKMDRRVFGYLGERLLDVWLMKKGLKTVELPVLNLESQHWVAKGVSFLKRKYDARRDSAD